ncbi:uncharacterized protein A1O9_10529 [Exophiala aquamarina CBS 119918]|uniref:SnoaL-like domain-containing protein n=1 Tax=Exophiala aquamarina CBS 119918 TaxID=1182545 RepID=A0A072P0A1_9EURO|nr:uncharacterized protein A1O9_10529 [Exophiala aquamarina CBS 119918]KEF53554.1 hypothetical protein A1O9_10529 [Exophiala aquamarina CBS 119918]
MDLRTIYNEYISTLNDMGYLRLSPFVAENVVHNSSKAMTPDEYGQMILDSTKDFKDFNFEVEDLVVEEDSVASNNGDGTVAARLKLSYEPPGIQPGLCRLVFYEHVFYRFEAGKISRVWSLVDLPKDK